MKTKKKIVIIGGTGFVGEYLVKQLKNHSDISLTVVYNHTPPQTEIKKVTYVQLDTLNQVQKLGEVVQDSDCLVLLHQPNPLLIENIINFSTGIKKIVYASTLLLYKDSPNKQNENAKIDPLTDYEVKKVLEEKLLMKYSKKHSIALCIARLTNMYGNIKNRGIIQKIMNALINKQEFVINGDGSQIRDYLFIEDATAILESLILMEQKNPCSIYNICTGKGYSLNQIISTIESVTHKTLNKRHGPPVKEKLSIIGDNRKVLSAIPYSLHFTLQQGLKKTYQNGLKNY